MEEAFSTTPLNSEFPALIAFARPPAASTILQLRHILAKHKLADAIQGSVNGQVEQCILVLEAGTAMDAICIAASFSIKNADKSRDPEIHSIKKGKKCRGDMKAHSDVDPRMGMVHTLLRTSGNVADLTKRISLLRRQKPVVFENPSYPGSDKHPDSKARPKWNVAKRPGKRTNLHKNNKAADPLKDKSKRSMPAFGPG